MLAFPGMLLSAAEQAGIKTPADLDNYDPKDYPHWQVYCNMQLGSPIPYAGCHWENAKVIAGIPDDKIKKLNFDEVVSLGFQIGYSR